MESAEVFGCGHANQLFEVKFLKRSPHVHMHHLTSNEELESDGQGKVEFVCHGCGDAQLVLYDASMSQRRSMALRNRFEVHHRGCPNRGYQMSCPNYRRSIAVIDTRRPS